MILRSFIFTEIWECQLKDGSGHIQNYYKKISGTYQNLDFNYTKKQIYKML